MRNSHDDGSYGNSSAAQEQGQPDYAGQDNFGQQDSGEQYSGSPGQNGHDNHSGQNNFDNFSEANNPGRGWETSSFAPQPAGVQSGGVHPGSAYPGGAMAAGMMPDGVTPGGIHPQQKKSGGMKLGVLGVIGLVAASALIGGGAGALVMANSTSNTAATSETQNALDAAPASKSNPAPEGSVGAVAQKVLPSVVSISLETRQGTVTGSGSILSADGLVLTNNHVAGGAAEPGAQMAVMLADGSTHPADLVAGDSATDIAVIKIRDIKGLTPITLGSSDQVQVGQEVVAVGSPLGLSSTVTQGIVSAKNRPVTAAGENGEQSVIDAIQTDAAINPGNSGGALVDMDGNLIGVPSVIASMGQIEGQSGSIGLGFAIPIDQARNIAEDLIQTGKAQMPVIGAQIDTRDATPGALVVDVSKGSPAEQAGLRRGDVITKLDDRPLDNGVALIAAIRSHRIGDNVTLTVTDERGGNEHTVEVTLGAASE